MLLKTLRKFSVDLTRKKNDVIKSWKRLPRRNLGTLNGSLKRVKRFCETNEVLTTLFKNLDLFLAEFRHFRICLQLEQ